MFTVLLYLLLAWFAYNLIFRFILPIYRTSKQMKKQFREMADRMQQATNQPQPGAEPEKKSTGPKQVPADDYIEFEEIRK